MAVNIFQSNVPAPQPLYISLNRSNYDSGYSTTSASWSAMPPAMGLTVHQASNKVLFILNLILSPNGIPAGTNYVQVTVFRSSPDTNLFDANWGCAQINTVGYSYHDDNGGVFMHFVDQPGAGTFTYWTYARSQPSGIICQVTAKEALSFELTG